MIDSALEPLLKKAKEEEKKYEWLQATEYYRKAADSAFKEKNYLKAAELQERLGLCFYRAAFQAQSNIEFQSLLKQAILVYEKEAEILEGSREENIQVRIDHVHALVAYTRSYLETELSKKKKLFNKCWTLEKQVLKAYETSGDLHSVGRTCNNLTEWSSYDQLHLECSFAERKKIIKEVDNLIEKAIQTLSKLDDKYELARAYCSYAGYFGPLNAQKIREYGNKALELSQEIGDAWMTGRSYLSMTSATMVRTDPALYLKAGENILKTSNITRDNYLIGRGKNLKSTSKFTLYYSEGEPDKIRKLLKESADLAEEATHNFEIINNARQLGWAYHCQSLALEYLAQNQTNPRKRQELLETTHKVIQEGFEKLGGEDGRFVGGLFFSLCINLMFLSHIKTDPTEKRDLLQKAEYYAKKGIPTQLEEGRNIPPNYFNFLVSMVRTRLANIETNKKKKITLLSSAASYEEKVIRPLEKSKKIFAETAFGGAFHLGMRYIKLGDILRQIYFLTKEQKTLRKAIETYKKAIALHKSADLPTRVAELCWVIAQLSDLQGEWLESSQNYELAAEAYDRSSKKTPSLKQFYIDYSSYLRAWSLIEQAKYSHSIEEYTKAKQHYEKAAELHESTDQWNYLAPNYVAWANMEEAEGLSRRENAQQAKQTFQKALKQFTLAEESIKQKLEKITSVNEKVMIEKLLKASDLRRKYCQARILLEEAKLLDREGKNLLSSKSYREASQNIEAILEKVEVEAERKELELLTILCQAWGKMANAEEATSSESYLHAATLFEKARERCFTKRASLWALGNSNFCKGLAAGIRYQDSMDLKENTLAKRYIKNAASSYLQAGFRNASEYAKATQRLFDAYVFMNQAESEVNPGKKAKQYQMAENLLQISAGSFMKAKQPEKTAQVQQILKTVREEKALAVSLTEVMHAPTITSSTLSFTAPTPTNEVSVGLETFEHANVQANLITHVKEVKVGESFCLSIEFVNAGKEPALLTRVEEFIPPDFLVVKKPDIYRLEENCLNMKGKQLAPLKLVEAKLVLQPSKKGVYQLKPRVNYLDEVGKKRFLELKLLEIKVEEVILEGRISTGTKELDSLLLGGIPNEYAVAFTGPPSDEREMIVRNFLDAGVREEEVTFYVTSEVEGLETLLKQPDFYLFLCNPKPKVELPDSPNVYRLGSKTDLTNLSISLARAYRNIEQSKKKRVCVEIVSDVLLHYKADATRKWVAELITDLGTKGFMMLAVMNPGMHPLDQVTAVLDLFDGEISLTRTKDAVECKTSIRVEKLRNQDYIKNPICLTSK